MGMERTKTSQSKITSPLGGVIFLWKFSKMNKCQNRKNQYKNYIVEVE
jgi:hypothetical protein